MADTTPVYGAWTGITYYTDEISRRLSGVAGDDTCLFVHEGVVSPEYDPPASAGGVRGRTAGTRFLLSVPAVAVAARQLRDWRWARRVRNSLGLRLPDVYFEPNIILHRYPARKRVVTVHDLSFVYHPEWFPGRAAALRSSVRQTVSAADLVLTGSMTIRDEIVDEFGIHEDRVRAIHHGVDHEIFHPAAVGEGSPPGLERFSHCGCVLSVCSLEPRKNLLTLLDAYALLPAPLRKDHPLVLAGLAGWRSQEVMNRLDGLQGDITYLGYVGRSDLAWLYRQASLFVYPSLYEGFGLPPLEALSSGTPVLLSDIPVLRELYADVAGFADVSRPDRLSSAIGELLGDGGLLADMQVQGPRLAAGFSWDRSARTHMACFRDVSGAAS